MALSPQEELERRFEGALHYLEAVAGDVPINATLTELQLVIERVGFSGIWEDEDQHGPETEARLETLFNGEVSAAMLDFIKWMARGWQLDILAGDKGRSLLEFAIGVYKKIPEVDFITAVPLADQLKMSITDRLRVIYPEPARILYSTSPLVTAGFIIQVGKQTIDKSLRNFVAVAISRTGRFSEMTEVGSNG